MSKASFLLKPSFITSVAICLIILGSCKNDPPTVPDSGNLQSVLSGIITLNGNPFASVDVYLSLGISKKTTTGADGKFNFENLSGGSYVITPSKKGYTFNPPNFEIESQFKNDLDFQAQSATYGSAVGDIAAEFTAKDQNGKDVALYDLFGQVILINFSADWCGPCRAEAPQLEELYKQYKDRGFRVISLQISGSPFDWTQEYNLTFPVLNDNSEKIWDIYGEGNIPLNIILDRNCTIRYKQAGFDDSQIEAIIKKHL